MITRETFKTTGIDFHVHSSLFGCLVIGLLGVLLKNSQSIRAHRGDDHLIFFSSNADVLHCCIIGIQLSNARHTLIVEIRDMMGYGMQTATW